MTRQYKWYHSSSGRVSAWKHRDRNVIDMTESCGVGHWAVSAVDRELSLLWKHTRGGQVMKFNTVDNINKVRGASLFPHGQLVCNKLQVVRLWRDRRGYRVLASQKILMQPEGNVSHRKPLSIHTGIMRSTAAEWLNHSHYCDIWHWGWNKGLCNRCVSYQAVSQWVLTYFQVKMSVHMEVSESSTVPTRNSSPPGHSHTQSVLNFHFTLGNQSLVSRAIEEKSHLAWE